MIEAALYNLNGEMAINDKTIFAAKFAGASNAKWNKNS